MGQIGRFEFVAKSLVEQELDSGETTVALDYIFPFGFCIDFHEQRFV